MGHRVRYMLVPTLRVGTREEVRQMIPSNIGREHVLKAIREIDSNGIPPGRGSRKFVLIFEGKKYPPKYVLSLSNKFADREELDPSRFDAQEANRFLKKLGFDIEEIGREIVPKPPDVETQLDFSFVRDEEVKRLLRSDWEEAQIAHQKGLYKSTIVLCGAILEALLVDALSRISNEAKGWNFYKLIDMAKQKGIISRDVAKLSTIVKDYRNLIHIWAQRRQGLRANREIASIATQLLTVAYNDILEWHRKHGATSRI